jgi:hypothetical protein
MDALEVERSLAAGEQARQALRKLVPARAHQRAAHDAEKGLFTRRRPRGLAAMKRSFAQRGTGEVGPAVTRADGELRPREKRRRGRADGARVGTFTGARTGDRTPGEPGSFPLDAQVTLPARCDSDCWPAWMTVFAVAHPVKERAGFVAPLFALEVAESVVMEVAQEAPQAYEAVSAPRPRGPAATAGALLGVSVDGQGVPRLQEAAAPLKAKWGTGETRPKQQAALVGGSSTVEPQPRAPEALAARLVDPEAARARQRREATRDEAPRAQQGRRVARLGRTQPPGLARIKAAAERRAPQPRHPLGLLLEGARCLGRLAPPLCRPWKRVTCVLDIRPVVGSRWAAAHTLCGAPSQAGTHGVQQKLTASRRGRVGDVRGGWRPLLTTPRRRPSVRETRATVIPCFPNHRCWRRYDAYVAAGLPGGTGVVASAGGSVVKHRLEGDGTRGSLAGAQAMLTWRSLTKSHDHDLRDDWRFRPRQMRGRLDGHRPKDRPTPPLGRVA